MGCTEEKVIGLKKEIEKAMKNEDEMNSEKTKELLLQLKCMKMKLAVLDDTRIGLTINSLRKNTKNTETSQLCKHLIKSWKKLLDDNAGSGDADGGGPPPAKEAKVEKTSSNNSSDNETASITSKDSSASKESGKPAGATFTADAVREKCRELLANALKLDTSDELTIFTDLDELAALIEDNIFLEFGETNEKYKTRVRSRVFNLKDKRNPDLKSNVITGKIAPERMAKMTADEMASGEMKALRQKLNKEAMNDHQMAVVEGTKTDLIQCGKCKKNNCTYSQMQTRSADEPMTTFVFCNECGNRWKFC